MDSAPAAASMVASDASMGGLVYNDMEMMEPQVEGQKRSETSYDKNSSGSPSETGDVVASERKLIYNGYLNAQVENLGDSEKSIRIWVEQWDGYITNSSTSANSLTITAHIPADKFQPAMDAVAMLGKLENRSISSQDVTEQFYDTYTRLETRKILRDRLQSYLSTAKDMKDMLSIESELNKVQSDIESMEGQFRRLSSLIDFATIDINVHLPYNTTEEGYTYPNIGQKMSRLWADTLNFLAAFLFGIFYVIIYGIPLFAAVAVVYVLGFGRIGLLRKLFSFLSKK